ncbi:MAG: hypothetical protein C7B45_14500 [Sulfobacillus acidophilus]|uniref:Uncharacterized protein n=1 Tax=Sulfobacillus acidophilus TaxID=53633 RepID=A0A2T2WEA0_9FIRM|nr:MAG: hypothetical protein C7B45_14500 [Sulfobacillus acidophilus]
MIDWTFDTEEVNWMTEQLIRFWDRRLASIAPVGFPRYGRLLHPARANDGTPVRWATVAAHNGLPMTATSDFSYLALPQHMPEGGVPWVGDPPTIGTLDSPQAEHLIDVLTSYTKRPDAVRFALWDGLGWDRTTLVRLGQAPTSTPDPIPPAVRDGPRMRIPGRDYFVYGGHIEEALRWMPSQHQTPHYWWPKDHAWVVAGDVDLPWSIIAGSRELVDRLLHDPLLEVVPIAEDDVLDPQPAWLTAAIQQAVRDLINHRTAVIETTRGAVSFHISDGGLWLESGRGSRTHLHPEDIHRSLKDQLSAGVSTALMSQLNLY